MFGFIKHSLMWNKRYRGYRSGTRSHRLGAERRLIKDTYAQAETDQPSTEKNGNIDGVCTLCRQNCLLSAPRCHEGEKLREQLKQR